MTHETDHLPDVIDGAAVIGITFDVLFVVSDPLDDEDALFVIGDEALRHAHEMFSKHRAEGRKVVLVVSLLAQSKMDEQARAGRRGGR